MKNNILKSLLLFVAFLILNGTVLPPISFAQSSDISAGGLLQDANVDDNQLFATCGYVRNDTTADLTTTRCCTADANTLDSQITTDEVRQNEWGCFLNLFCLSKFFNDTRVSTKTVLTQGFVQDINLVPSCKGDGLPTLDGKSIVTDISQKVDPACYCISPNDIATTAINEAATASGGQTYPTSRLCNNYVLKGINGGVPVSELIRDKEYINCLSCSAGGGYYSGLGCFYYRDFQTFITKNVFGPLFGVAGMASMACIIYAAILFQVSKGEQEKIQEARDMITSCIIGLLVIIFSMVILRIIGVDILKIPFLNS